MKVAYKYRLVLDQYFTLNLFTGDAYNKQQSHDMIKILTRIKKTSKDYPDEHNIILEKQFEYIKTQEVTAESILRSFLMPFRPPMGLSNGNPVSDTVLSAIQFTMSEPYVTVILTDASKKDEYLNNSHFKGLTGLKVRAGDDCYELLKTMMNSYEWAKS